ncbi:MAG: (2Fe-2S)-binding protein [Ignavibacteriales bacterium]
MTNCRTNSSRAGIAFTGFPSPTELAASPGFTPEEWLWKGPKAVIECVEEIPCNPCEHVCPRKAIVVGDPITNLPRIDPAKCTGCCLCIPACPGQAIFVVDMSHAAEAFVSFPWEYLPEPVAGKKATACDREGRPVCEATIARVVCPPKYDRTRVVTVAIPKEHALTVRGVMRETSGENARDPVPSGARCEALAGVDDEIICRCEEVTRAEIRQAIQEGATTLSGVRRRTRAGMGLCQGRTCRRLVAQELERATGGSPVHIGRETARPPVMPVSLRVLAGETRGNCSDEGESADR